MPELDIPQPGETIASGTFGQPVVFRVISRYASAAARDAANPTPSAGDPAYLQDSLDFQIHDGTGWQTFDKLDALQTQTVDIDNGVLLEKGQFVYTWRDNGTVTCAWSVRLPALSPEDPVLLSGAIPTQFRPTGGDLSSFASPFNSVGTTERVTTYGGEGRFLSSGSFRLTPANPAIAQGLYRGFASWVIGTTAATDPPQ